MILTHRPVGIRTTNSSWRAACALNNKVWNHLKRATAAHCTSLRVRVMWIASLRTWMPQPGLMISIRCPTSTRNSHNISQRLPPRTWGLPTVRINSKTWNQRLDKQWRAISDTAPNHNRLYRTFRSPACETDFPKLQTSTPPIWNCTIVSQTPRAPFPQYLNWEK